VDYLIQAGDAAAQLYAHPEARLHYAQAREVLSKLPDTEDNRRRQVDVTLKHVTVSWAADRPEVNLERLAEAEARLQSLSGPEGTSGSDRVRLARVRYWMGRLHYLRNEPREAIGYYRQVLAVAQDIGDEELLAIPSSFIGQAMLVQGHFGKAETFLSQAIIPLEKTGNWLEWIRSVGFLGVSLAARGQYSAGIAEAERSLTHARKTHNLLGMAMAHIYLSVIHLTGEEVPRLLETSRAGLEAAEQSGNRMLSYLELGFQAWGESRLGQHQQALESMAQSQAIGQALGGRLILADWLTAANAEINLAAGRVEEALTLAEETVNAAKSTGGIFAEGLAQRVWGEALAALDPPRREEAQAHMADSLKALETGEARLEAARTHVAWGLICRAGNDVAAARDHFEQAAAQFEASRMVGALEKTRQLLAELKD